MAERTRITKLEKAGMNMGVINKNKQEIRILLLEDDDGDAKAVERAFQKADISNPITRALDGVEALEILRGENGKEKIQKPFIILADLNMPRMDGISFLKILRQDKSLKHAIVFMLTTSRKEEDKLAAYDANIAGYILKETAGSDFLQLIDMLNFYWRVVELPN